MITPFTRISVKDLQRLQGIKNYESARRFLVTIRDSFSVDVVLVFHLAKYFGVPEEKIIASLLLPPTLITNRVAVSTP